MEICVNLALGGDVAESADLSNVIFRLVIEMRKTLKAQFRDKCFDGLNKMKITIFVSGDVSEYSPQTGIKSCRYYQKKKEVQSSCCISSDYWLAEPLLDRKQKFLLFLEQTFADLSVLIEKKLKVARCDFDSEAFKESLSKSLMDLSSEKK